MTYVPSRAGGGIPRLFSFLALAGLTALLTAAPAWAGSFGDDGYPPSKAGHASFYGSEFAGHRTASGDRFDPNALTAAHRTLPLGTKVRVTNLHNGRSVLVTITDRGPYVRNREIDLSAGAARELKMVNRGVAQVLIEPL
jgi:rare lipoprotein A